jgi:hypothetical protein
MTEAAPLPRAGKTLESVVVPNPRPEIVSHPSGDVIHVRYGDSANCGELRQPQDCVPTPLERFYARGEYLLWWIRDTRVPPLVTTGPAASEGIIGRSGTAILLGQSPLSNEERSGGRITAGYWLDACQTVGIEGSFFVLGDRTVSFPFTSNEFPLLARPFFNLNLGREDAQIGVFPGLSTGSVSADLSSRLWGGSADFRANLCQDCSYRVDLLGGFRYLDLRESLQITEDLNVLATSATFAGSHILVNDRFGTHNQFYGAEIGTLAEYHWGFWFVDLRAKVAIGNTHQVVDVNGFQIITSPTGATSTFTGGLLALATNIGRTSRDHWALVPEVNLNVGYQFSQHWRAFVGYDFLYWSHVLRPGDQIDRGLDVTFIPNFSTNLMPTGQVRPAVPLRETGFWAQGVNLGVEFRF